MAGKNCIAEASEAKIKWQVQCKTALSRNKLPYSPVFACITVYSASENPHDIGSQAFNALGPPVILNPSIMSELSVGCSMDFQNAISRSNGHEAKKVFRDLRGKSPDKIEQELLTLIKKRPSYTWSEARIYRLLIEGDVLENRYRDLNLF